MRRDGGRDTSSGCRNGDGQARTVNLGSAPGTSTQDGGIKERKQPPGRVPSSDSGSQSQKQEDVEMTVINKVKFV